MVASMKGENEINTYFGTDREKYLDSGEERREDALPPSAEPLQGTSGATSFSALDSGAPSTSLVGSSSLDSSERDLAEEGSSSRTSRAATLDPQDHLAERSSEVAAGALQAGKEDLAWQSCLQRGEKHKITTYGDTTEEQRTDQQFLSLSRRSTADISLEVMGKFAQALSSLQSGMDRQEQLALSCFSKLEDKIDERAASVKRSISNLTTRVGALEARVEEGASEMSQRVGDLTSRVAALESKAEEGQSKVTDLRSKVITLSSRVGRKLGQLESRLGGVEEKVSTLGGNLGRLDLRVQSIQQELGLQLKGMQKKVDESREMQDRLQSICEDLQRGLRSQLSAEEEKEEVDDLDKMCRRLEEMFKGLQEDLRSQLDSMQAQITFSYAMYYALETRLQQTQEKEREEDWKMQADLHRRVHQEERRASGIGWMLNYATHVLTQSALKVGINLTTSFITGCITNFSNKHSSYALREQIAKLSLDVDDLQREVRHRSPIDFLIPRRRTPARPANLV